MDTTKSLDISKMSPEMVNMLTNLVNNVNLVDGSLMTKVMDGIDKVVTKVTKQSLPNNMSLLRQDLLKTLLTDKDVKFDIWSKSVDGLGLKDKDGKLVTTSTKQTVFNHCSGFYHTILNSGYTVTKVIAPDQKPDNKGK